jgi:hypothetical protein
VATELSDHITGEDASEGLSGLLQLGDPAGQGHSQRHRLRRYSARAGKRQRDPDPPDPATRLAAAQTPFGPGSRERWRPRRALWVYVRVWCVLKIFVLLGCYFFVEAISFGKRLFKRLVYLVFGVAALGFGAAELLPRDRTRLAGLLRIGGVGLMVLTLAVRVHVSCNWSRPSFEVTIRAAPKEASTSPASARAARRWSVPAPLRAAGSGIGRRPRVLRDGALWW